MASRRRTRLDDADADAERESIPLGPRGGSTGVSPSARTSSSSSPPAGRSSLPCEREQDQSGHSTCSHATASRPRQEENEWTWDTIPLTDLLGSAWAGMVGDPPPPIEGEDSPAQEHRYPEWHDLQRAWDDFDVSQHADPSKALLVILVLGVLFWIFPSVTVPVFGWTWRHTLGYPFQPSSSSSLSSSSSCLSHSTASVRNATTPSSFCPSACTPTSWTSTMPWQTEFVLSSRTKGIHLVTDEVQNAIADGLRNTQVGLLHLFIKHTSASLALGENFDYEVRTDMDRALDHIVPERGGIRWDHVDEGLDDSVSHTKNFLGGSSIQIPITNGRLNLGTWQGIYLAEFRRMSHSRRIVATIIP